MIQIKMEQQMKIKNKFTKLKEGTYTVRYTATNSWGCYYS